MYIYIYIYVYNYMWNHVTVHEFHWFNHFAKKYVSTLSNTILDAPFQAKPSAKADVQGHPTLENGQTPDGSAEIIQNHQKVVPPKL